MWNAYSNFHIMDMDYGEEIYKSLQSDDYCAIVMKLYEKKNRMTNEVSIEKKSESKSEFCRIQGNDAFKSRSFKKALTFYNMAICYAPKNSRALKIAYSNRSALLCEVQEFEDALKDIEKCYQLNCSDDLVQKLKNREEKCHRGIYNNKIQEMFLNSITSSCDIVRQGFCHSDEIPCASRKVKFDTSGAYPKVVAMEDINVGEVVALETSYVSSCDSHQDAYLMCYHCMKPSLNLIPCENCCLVMFCDEACKNLSYNEYHAIECKLLQKQDIGLVNFILKAVIKMKNSCIDWEEFIQLSNTDQTIKMDHEKSFSQTNLFNIFGDIRGIYVSFGKKYYAVHLTLYLIKKLEHIKTYFPSSRNEKLLAIRATAKLSMYLLLYSRRIVLSQCSRTSPSQISESFITSGFYMFSGKLEHACHSNLFVSAINNKAVLTALQPIRRGTPLTISYVGHYFFHEFLQRTLNMYSYFSTVCSCKVCTEKWGKEYMKNYKLSPAQKQYFKEIGNLIPMAYLKGFKSAFQKVCLGLELFKDSPNTSEYIDIFKAFFKFQQIARYATTKGRSLLDI